MSTSSSHQYKLRKLMASLSSKEGTAKNLVSVYIPKVISIEEIDIVLKQKLDSSEIKSQDVRREVQAELGAIIHYLRERKGEISNNGLAIFAAISESSSKDVQINDLIPPYPITEFIFSIDDHFNLDTLRTMLRQDRLIGVIAMDADQAGFGILDGEKLDVVDHITSGISGKTDKGGWSQRRYERERDMELTYFFHRIADHATDVFITKQKVSGLIVGGPGFIKEDFLKENILRYELKNMLISQVDTALSGKEGVKEALEKSGDAVKKVGLPQETKLVQRLETDIEKKDGMAISGLSNVLDALSRGVADTVLVADNTGLIEIVMTCKKCGNSRTRLVHEDTKMKTTQQELLVPCEKCNGLEYEIEDRDIVDVLEDAASVTDAKVEVISSDSHEKQKLVSLGGVAALLRYKAS